MLNLFTGFILGLTITYLAIFIKRKMELSKLKAQPDEELASIEKDKKIKKLEEEISLLQKEMEKQSIAKTQEIKAYNQNHENTVQKLSSSIQKIKSILTQIKENQESLEQNENQNYTLIKTNCQLLEKILNEFDALLEIVSTFERWYEGLSAVKSSIYKMDQMNNEFKDIASKTALLSLNARIESTRAGAAGAGFTVVAQEFFELAGKIRHLSKELVTELHKNDLLVTVAFQDTQAGSRMFVNAANKIKYMVKDLHTNISQHSEKQGKISSMEEMFDQINTLFENIHISK